MREILISKRNLVALVDDEDHEWLNKARWSLDGAGYAHAGDLPGYAWITMHKAIQHHHNLLKPGRLVTDHIDGDKLNNQKANLRQVTGSQNVNFAITYRENGKCKPDTKQNN